MPAMLFGAAVCSPLWEELEFSDKILIIPPDSLGPVSRQKLSASPSVLSSIIESDHAALARGGQT
jgi:hypothetical protein